MIKPKALKPRVETEYIEVETSAPDVPANDYLGQLTGQRTCQSTSGLSMSEAFDVISTIESILDLHQNDKSIDWLELNQLYIQALNTIMPIGSTVLLK